MKGAHSVYIIAILMTAKRSLDDLETVVEKAHL